MNLILTAGRASRLGEHAPHGCKALTLVKGRPIIEWQLDVLGEARIVARSDHKPLLEQYGEVVVDDTLRGPGHAASVGMRDEPTLIVYADTWFDAIPDGGDWVGVGCGSPGRPWDRVWPGGAVHYEHCDEPVVACVGLYHFDDHRWLRERLDRLSGFFWAKKEWGMAPVVNAYRRQRFVPVPSWRDYGTPELLAEVA